MKSKFWGIFAAVFMTLFIVDGIREHQTGSSCFIGIVCEELNDD